MIDALGKHLRRAAKTLVAPSDPRPLALFRVVLGLALLLESWTNLQRAHLYTPETFHIPYVPWIEPQSAEDITTLFEIGRGAALALTLGLFTRTAALVGLLSLGYAFLICQLNFRNHVYLELTLLLLLSLSAAGHRWSLDALLQKLLKRPPKPAPPILIQRLVGYQICIVYFYATLHKISPGFLSGYPLGKALSRAIPRSKTLGALLEPDVLQKAGTILLEPAWSVPISYLTVATEGFLALGLLFRRTRPLAVALGISLHLGIAVGMDIYTFGLVMTGAYFCFWTPEYSAPSHTAPPPRGKDDQTH